MKITGEMTIEEVVMRYPRTVPIFYKHGLPPIACGEPVWGTIAENAERNNVADLEALIRDLNRIAAEGAGPRTEQPG
jgi:iron-sulfur cluster repair protein YtfE (RIC family)